MDQEESPGPTGEESPRKLQPWFLFCVYFLFYTESHFFLESGLCFCQGIPSNKIPLTYTQKKENKLLTHWSHDKVMLLMSIGLGLNVDAPSKDS